MVPDRAMLIKRFCSGLPECWSNCALRDATLFATVRVRFSGSELFARQEVPRNKNKPLVSSNSAKVCKPTQRRHSVEWNPPLSAIAVNPCKTKRTHGQLTEGEPTLCVRAFV